MQLKIPALVFFSTLLLTQGFADHPQFGSVVLNEKVFLVEDLASQSSSNNSETSSNGTNTANSSSSMKKSTEKNEYRSLVEFKAGYFFFTDHKMRKVFDQGGLDLQLCASGPVWQWLHVYGSVEYLEKHGRSLGRHQKTRIWEIPLSLGLEAVAKIGKMMQYYFTIGPRYIFVHVHTKSHFFDKTMNQNGLGGFANTGFHFFPTEHLVIDIFGEYSYARMHFHPHKKHVYGDSRQVGGLTFGGGIGYVF